MTRVNTRITLSCAPRVLHKSLIHCLLEKRLGEIYDVLQSDFLSSTCLVPGYLINHDFMSTISVSLEV